jgi:hypothetical protein
MALYRNVRPILMVKEADRDTALRQAEKLLVEQRRAQARRHLRHHLRRADGLPRRHQHAEGVPGRLTVQACCSERTESTIAATRGDMPTGMMSTPAWACCPATRNSSSAKPWPMSAMPVKSTSARRKRAGATPRAACARDSSPVPSPASATAAAPRCGRSRSRAVQAVRTQHAVQRAWGVQRDGHVDRRALARHRPALVPAAVVPAAVLEGAWRWRAGRTHRPGAR